MKYDPDLIRALDPAQITSETLKPLPRKRLGRGAMTLLVLLRVYVVIAIPIVGYAFTQALQAVH